jgi:hypothetical protein
MSSTFEESLGTARNRAEFASVANEGRFLNYLGGLRRGQDMEQFLAAPVTGRIAEGWRDLDVKGPLFQQSLVEVATHWPGTWTPAEYLLHYAMACKRQFSWQREYDLGRSLRNLPSLLREYLLHDALLKKGIDCTIPTIEENAEGHADIWIHHNGRRIALWSFQATPNGFEKIALKIRHRAKGFPDLNLLAPFDTQNDGVRICDWSVPGEVYVSRLATVLLTPRFLSTTELREWLSAGTDGNTTFAVATASAMQQA